jgi:replicative DNA helicase
MAESPLLSGVGLFDTWKASLLDAKPTPRFNVGPAFDHIEVAPGRILLVGGAPGAGKSALIMQWVFDGLALNPELRAVVCNVEMAPSRLLDRQLARLSGVPLTTIRRREIADDQRDQIGKGLSRIGQVVPRLGFVKAPYTLDRVADAADELNADLIVLDYAQRIDPPGRFQGMREKTSALMAIIRQMAETGVCILAAAALTRSRDGKGRSSYEGQHLSLASFRESSELEYGADDAFLLYPTDGTADPNDPTRLMTLNHAKSRDGETKDTQLVFHRRFQAFKPGESWTIIAKGSPPSPASRIKGGWKKVSDDGADKVEHS